MRLTKAQKEAKKQYLEGLLEQGIEKEVAEVMADVFTEYGLINTSTNN